MDIIRRITSRGRQEFADRMAKSRPPSPAMGLLGLQLADHDEDKVRYWTGKIAKAELVAFVRGQQTTEKSKKAWHPYLPELKPDEQLAIEFLASALPWWESLAHIPGFCGLVETQIMGSLVQDIGREAGSAQQVEQGNSAWAAKRPEQHRFASSLAEKVIHQLHRGAGGKHREFLHQLYLSGFRQIDLHISSPAEKSQGPVTVLQYNRNDLPDSETEILHHRRFVPLLSLPLPEHHLSDNDPLIGHLMLDVLQTGGGVNHDHFVISFVKYHAPLSTIPTYRLAHKGIGNVSLFEAIYALDWTSPQIAHELGNVVMPTPPSGLQSIMPNVWFQSNRVIPGTLSCLGLYPYLSSGFRDAVNAIKETCPEFAQATVGYPHLAELCLYKAFVLSSTTVQLEEELQQLARYLGYEGKTSTAEGQVALISKHQQQALDWLVDRYKLVTAVPAKRPVTSAPSTNWCGHGEWYLLPEHIADMSKDGMSKRTIKMSGCYSVLDNEDKEKIFSRFGRSRVRRRVEELGSLLVYPNPLIPHERHSKTEHGEPKYLAPEGSISPPMLIPVQAQFTAFNREYLTQLSEQSDIIDRSTALSKLVSYERKVDLSEYTQHLLRLGHRTDHAARLAEHTLKHSTLSSLYDALTDPEAEVEITEGQKKAYKMFQSYKELIEAEDFAFLETLSAGEKLEDLERAIKNLPRRKSKLFICSPGVWQPVKSWRKFSPEEKKSFLTSRNLPIGESHQPASPLNPTNKYCLTEPWTRLVDCSRRRIIITYDQDADQNPAVALSVSALAQSFLDAFLDCQVCYRRIETRNGKVAKGADDFLVAHGNLPFWNGLQVYPVAPNVSHGELVGQPGNSYIGYLIAKALGAKGG